jgi:hypothetical protein
MKYKYRNWGCFNIFLSGLITAIAINYLVVGFIDFILNIDKLLQWLQSSGVMTFVTSLFGGK